MQHSLYLVTLLISLAGMAYIDYRYRLALWRNKRAALALLLIGLTFFLFWDVAGVQLRIFFSGHSAYMLGIYVMPNVPIEELLFLTLLLYVPLVASSWLEIKHV